MTTISDLDGIIRSADGSISYRTVDAAQAAAVDTFIKSNLSVIGKNASEVTGGFQALTKEVDYDHELVFGTAPVLFNQDPALDTPVENLMQDPSAGTIPAVSFGYNMEMDSYGATFGFDLSIITQSVSSIITANSGIEPATTNHNHRMITTGSPKAVMNSLTQLENKVGPWSDIYEFINAVAAAGFNLAALIALFKPVIITDTNRQEFLDAVSALETPPTSL